MNQLRIKISDEIYSNLPDELKDITDLFEGREKDIVLLSSLGVISNCFPNIVGVYDGVKVTPHLYVMIIAPPASGKGVMNYSRTLIDEIHSNTLNKSRVIIKEFKSKDENKGKKTPEISVKILPANISTSEMYTMLNNTKDGLLIFESEADTMSNMLKNDWSNYSDVLRKAFHHEPISISRKIEKIYVEVKRPKISVVISGTPNQLQPLIQSVENGLFSRFIIYNFNEIAPFKNVFDEKKKNYIEKFKKLGEKISKQYDKSINSKNIITFKLTEEQKKIFLEKINNIRDVIIDKYPEGFISNLHRHGLIFFRIAMILSAVRQMESLSEETSLICSDKDFSTAFNITSQVLKHSLYTYKSMQKQYLNLTQDDKLFIDSLKDSFTSAEAYKIGKKLNIKSRTVTDKLNQYVNKHIIERVSKGNYRKL